MKELTIDEIQGDGWTSPYTGQEVTTQGVVTGTTRKGFFIQRPGERENPAISCAVFVYSPAFKPRTGSVVEVDGVAVDYVGVEGDRPTTQVEAREVRVVARDPVARDLAARGPMEVLPPPSAAAPLVRMKPSSTESVPSPF